MVIISTNFEKNNFHQLRTKGWKNKKGITEVTEDGILAFLDMKVSV
jgi:hypothetical protein